MVLLRCSLWIEDDFEVKSRLKKLLFTSLKQVRI